MLDCNAAIGSQAWYENQVKILLATEAEHTDSEQNRTGGCWMDSGLQESLGSKLRLLARTTNGENTKERFGSYVRFALARLVRQGYATKVEVLDLVAEGVAIKYTVNIKTKINNFTFEGVV